MSQAHSIKLTAASLQLVTGSEKIKAQPNFTIKVISDESTPLLLLRTLAWA